MRRKAVEAKTTRPSGETIWRAIGSVSRLEANRSRSRRLRRRLIRRMPATTSSEMVMPPLMPPHQTGEMPSNAQLAALAARGGASSASDRIADARQLTPARACDHLPRFAIIMAQSTECPAPSAAHADDPAPSNLRHRGRGPASRCPAVTPDPAGALPPPAGETRSEQH
jgi:hypothetical protein